MAITLDSNHKWDVHQTFGRLLDSATTPGKTWVAVIIDKSTGRPVVKSQLSATRGQAVAEAETKYKARKG